MTTTRHRVVVNGVRRRVSRNDQFLRVANRLLMAFKLLEMAQRQWRRLNGAHLLPLVRAGVTFVDGLPQARGETEMEARKEAA